MDGFMVSVVAGWMCKCFPRMPPVDPAFEGPYKRVEVAFPTHQPEPFLGVWERHAEDAEAPTGTVYGFVPAAWVTRLLRAHGGEDAERIASLHGMQQNFMFGPENFGANLPEYPIQQHKETGK
jgi:hypothetical protein